MSERVFPEDFVWGAASCPACSEGETVSDWGRLSAPDGSVPDDGPKHWRRYRYDFRAMADLGLSAYRFGLDWARLQRAPYGPLDRNDGYRYLEMLAELRSLGIEPWLVLFQDALPRWASSAGGWLNPETPHWFADFARRLADLTDGEVRHWVTVHEPAAYAMSCYAWDAYPGGCWGRLDRVRQALGRLREGHTLAASALRRRLPGAKVGVSLPGGAFVPRRVWHPGDWLAAGVSDWMLNRHALGGFLRGDSACDFLMFGVGNELGVGMRDSLSLTSGVSSSLPERMRHGSEQTAARRRGGRLRSWVRRTGLPVYLVGRGRGDSPDAGLGDLLAVYAGRAAGFFYEPLLDQFDPHRGLGGGGGLLRVDFHSPDRRRDMRGFARRYGRMARTGTVEGNGE